MIKVLVVADFGFLEEHLCCMLEDRSEFKVDRCATSDEEIIEKCSVSPPDLIIVCLRSQENWKFSFIKKIKAKYMTTQIVILGAAEDKKYINTALKSGADGYIMDNFGTKEFLHVLIKDYVKIKSSSEYNENLYDKNCIQESTIPKEQLLEVHLTGREKEVLGLVIDGMTNYEIAHDLGISVGRARNIVTELITKFMVKNRTQLAVLAVKMCIIS